MYNIGRYFLTIKAKTDKEFLDLYDKAILKIPNDAFNKKWYRSPKRCFCGWQYGKKVYIIPMYKPTLKKILKNY